MQIIFVHGMFQNSKSWNKWVRFFEEKGHSCVAPAWPLHDGEPMALRENPPAGLGNLSLDDVLSSMEAVASKYESPIMIGHSVGGLITQLLLRKGIISGGVGISSVAPNAMLDFDWGFLKNSAIIANPLKGDEPIYMDAKTFHAAFANSLSESESALAFDQYATHDSRNVLRGCMGLSGHVDVDAPHKPLLLIGAEKDQIVPAHLVKKNADAYTDETSSTEFKDFAGRSHYICGEPGWEEVADYVEGWVSQLSLAPAQENVF